MRVVVRQIHTGTIEQHNAYNVPDSLLDEYNNLEDDTVEGLFEKEVWLLQNCQEVFSSLKPYEIAETVEVEILEGDV